MADLFLRRIDRFLFLNVSIVVLVGQLFLGLEVITIRLDFVMAVLVVTILQAFVSTLSFTGFMSLSGILFLKQLLERPTIGDENQSEPVAAIVPVYRDANVLATSVTSLVQSSHPVRVTIVCEPDDEGSIREADRLATKFEQVTVLENTRYPGSKAGAINYAVEQTEERYIGVFDADERVHPEFLTYAVDQLEGADVVQGRTIPRPDGFVESLAYYESVLLSYAGRRILYSLTGFRMAASRAIVFRREAIERVGGYDPTMLTEDYYFAYQCYTAGLIVQEMLHAPSTIDAAHTFTDWWGQRKRWFRGYMQVFHQLLSDATPPTNYRDVLGILVCGSSILGGVLLISLLSKFLVLFVIGAGILTMIPLCVVVALAAVIRYLDYRRGPLTRPGISWLVAPLLFPLYGFAAVKAFIEYVVRGTGDWYPVEKQL